MDIISEKTQEFRELAVGDYFIFPHDESICEHSKGWKFAFVQVNKKLGEEIYESMPNNIIDDNRKNKSRWNAPRCRGFCYSKCYVKKII